MIDFSIELASERIDDARTREYFKEVLGSYINGNYRSAIVMLWTIVICDMIYKLQQMRDVYGDDKAAEILQEIEDSQRKNPKSPDWEEKLLSLVRDRTVLLEAAEFIELQHLQQQRHLSAHPVLTQGQLLHNPTQETTRALIRSSLEALLLKPPILTKEVIKTFVQDIATKKDILPDDQSLKRYIEATYLKNLKPAVEDALFAALWKFAFRLSNADTETNRQINLRALHILYRLRPTEIDTYIRNHPANFSNINESFLVELINFLSEHPNIYRYLNDAAQALIESASRKNVHSLVKAIFLSDNLNEHLQKIIVMIRNLMDRRSLSVYPETWTRILDIATTINNYSELVDLIIDVYCVSGSFDSAAERFSYALRPLIPYISGEQALCLLQGIENNAQTYVRRNTSIDHKLIKDRCDQVLGTNYDYSSFPNFIESLDLE